jgi:hypothetical protein
MAAPHTYEGFVAIFVADASAGNAAVLWRPPPQASCRITPTLAVFMGSHAIWPCSSALVPPWRMGPPSMIMAIASQLPPVGEYQCAHLLSQAHADMSHKTVLCFGPRDDTHDRSPTALRVSAEAIHYVRRGRGMRSRTNFRSMWSN